MNIKKLLCVGLSAVLATGAAAALAGCNKSDMTSDGKIWVKIGMWPDTSSTSDVAMFKEWEAAFEADHPEYDIQPARFVYSPEAFTAGVTAGELPTIFQTWLTEPQDMIESGSIADITDELKELKVSDAPDAKNWLEVMDPEMRAQLSDSDGRIYGVPRDGYAMGLFLNLEMLNSVGVVGKDSSTGKYLLYKDDSGNFYTYDEYIADQSNAEPSIYPAYPTTFEDITDVSQDIVDNMADGKYGIAILSSNKNGGWQFSNFAWNFGVENLQVKDANGNWTSKLDSAAAVEALDWIADLKLRNLIPENISVTYNDWYTKIGDGSIAMAFCGSDAIASPVSNSTFNKDNIAFVPMPAKEGVDAKALYGGTPFVFAPNATSRQIKGALMFLEYMGRSPIASEIEEKGMVDGNKVANSKGLPILPTIKPWTNEEYLTLANKMESEYVNVNMDYFNDFFNSIQTMKHAEEPNFCQAMYDELDKAIRDVFMNPTLSCETRLSSANSNFQKNYLDKLNKR